MNYANVYKGLDRADVNRFILLFTELKVISNRHKYIQTSFDTANQIAGKTNVIDWKEYDYYSKENYNQYQNPVRGRQRRGSRHQ